MLKIVERGGLQITNYATQITVFGFYNVLCRTCRLTVQFIGCLNWDVLEKYLAKGLSDLLVQIDV